MLRVSFSVIKWAAREVQRQMDGPEMVPHLISAYDWARNNPVGMVTINVDWVDRVGRMVHPFTNRGGFRHTEVYFASGGYAVPAHEVHEQLWRLCEYGDELSLDEWVHRFLVIHPFADGNGRTAAVIYNVLGESLVDDPVPLPEYEFR